MDHNPDSDVSMNDDPRNQTSIPMKSPPPKKVHRNEAKTIIRSIWERHGTVRSNPSRRNSLPTTHKTLPSNLAYGKSFNLLVKNKESIQLQNNSWPSNNRFCIKFGHYLKRVKIEKQEREKAQFRQGTDKGNSGKKKKLLRLWIVKGWVCCVSVSLEIKQLPTKTKKKKCCPPSSTFGLKIKTIQCRHNFIKPKKRTYFA